ncbi:MAG: alpha/beta fold hydrolase [Deltaproteobacteria bacterium]|nr:alpha/beta fold hydrolase [Deltaproteobacteria bacterium]
MATPVAMPRLGMSMKEGRVVEWPFGLGTHVAKGDIVVIIESEKTEVQIEATQSGVLRHIYVQVDGTVPCGKLLAALTDSADEAFDADAFRTANDLPDDQARTAPRAASQHPAVSPKSDLPRRAVAPAARALARQLGVDVEQVPGSGPGGRVTKEDVEAWGKRAERLVEVSAGVRLEVLRDGQGDPLVLLPGFGTDIASFAPQVRALAATHQVVGIHPRGVGASDAPQAGCYAVATAAADIAALCDAPAHIVGASLGAAVAIELALAHPQKVRSLTLITPFVEASARLLAVVDAWCRIASEASIQTLAMALLPWLFSEHTLSDEAACQRIVRGLVPSLAAVSAPALRRTAAGLRAWSGSRGADLDRISAPTLVIVGAGDLLTANDDAVAKRIAGARNIVVEQSGHALTIEAADRVTQAIADHLRAHSA